MSERAACFSLPSSSSAASSAACRAGQDRQGAAAWWGQDESGQESRHYRHWANSIDGVVGQQASLGAAPHPLPHLLLLAGHRQLRRRCRRRSNRRSLCCLRRCLLCLQRCLAVPQPFVQVSHLLQQGKSGRAGTHAKQGTQIRAELGCRGGAITARAPAPAYQPASSHAPHPATQADRPACISPRHSSATPHSHCRLTHPAPAHLDCLLQVSQRLCLAVCRLLCIPGSQLQAGLGILPPPLLLRQRRLEPPPAGLQTQGGMWARFSRQSAWKP